MLVACTGLAAWANCCRNHHRESTATMMPTKLAPAPSQGQVRHMLSPHRLQAWQGGHDNLYVLPHWLLDRPKLRIFPPPVLRLHFKFVAFNSVHGLLNLHAHFKIVKYGVDPLKYAISFCVSDLRHVLERPNYTFFAHPYFYNLGVCRKLNTVWVVVGSD